MKLRKTLQLISLLLFPVTIYYFSPAIIIYGITESIITGSFIVFGILMVTSIFSRRLFCSTLCPAGAVQDLMIDIHNKPIKSLKLSKSKWVVFGIWFGIVIYLSLEYGYNKIDPFYQTKYGISVYEPGGYIVLYGVLGIFMILAAFFGNRGGCHTICWMAPFMIVGEKIGGWLKIPSYRLVITNNSCISCGKCTKACPMGLQVQGMVHEEDVNHYECISCSKCVSVCPKKVLAIQIK